MICKYRNCTDQVVQNVYARGGPPKVFCSKKHKDCEASLAYRDRAKALVIETLGNRCKRCGWDEHQNGLQAHHVDPTSKEFSPGEGRVSPSRLLAELAKCVLLCANCHHVIHATKDPEWLKV